MSITPAAFMSTAPAPLSGSDRWASRYAAELRRVVHEHAARAPRTLQRHLGPSELGYACDRQVAGKMAGGVPTNHVSDPWPAVLGTATHAWLADAFRGDNERRGYLRWLTEYRVTPGILPAHPGTLDLYDAYEQAVTDHKVLGETTLAKVRSAGGPPRHYVVQLLLYGDGARALGLPVRRVALAAYPRTAPSLDGLYVWTREHTSADDELLEEVRAQTAIREWYAQRLQRGEMRLSDIPMIPSDDECHFCPFYRPQAQENDAMPGCPGKYRESRIA